MIGAAGVRVLFVIGLLGTAFAVTAFGHVGFHGGTVVRLYGERTEFTMKLMPEDAWMLLPGRQTLADGPEDDLEALKVFRQRAPHLYQITTATGVLEPLSAEVTHVADGYFLFVIDYPPATLPFHVRVVLAEEFGLDFQASISVYDLRRNPRAGESTLIAAAIQTGENAVLEVAEPEIARAAPGPVQAAPSQAKTLGQFLRLGLEQILRGYDHLLFLLALVVGCRRLKSIVVIIASFTLAYSLTLALSAFNLIQVSARVTGPLIAASVVLVGALNLISGEGTRGRAGMAFGFGLIHGLGLAEGLKEAGAGGTPIALPLFSFNLGVEIGLISVAVIVLLMFQLLRRLCPKESYVNPPISVAVVLAGTFWLAERLWPS